MSDHSVTQLHFEFAGVEFAGVELAGVRDGKSKHPSLPRNPTRLLHQSHEKSQLTVRDRKRVPIVYVASFEAAYKPASALFGCAVCERFGNDVAA